MRIFRYPLHEQYPVTKRLQIHLENEQTIRFNDGDKVADILKELKSDTQLIKFFKLNSDGKHVESLNLKYYEMPKHFMWNENDWKIREKY
jgi:hypothetical protein